MSDGFENLIGQTRGFLAELAQNNTRDWFAEHKPRFEAELKRPAKMLLDTLAPELAKLSDAPITCKLFRPQRDLRFTKDKTPYNTHLHLLWSTPGNGPKGNAENGPGFFFGISQEYVSAGAGWMRFTPKQVTKWRKLIDGAQGADIQAQIEALGARMDRAELKRVPPAFDAEHPRAELLKRKSLALWRDGLETGSDDLTARLSQSFAELWPVLDSVRTELG